jgi:hypothetical protein
MPPGVDDSVRGIGGNAGADFLDDFAVDQQIGVRGGVGVDDGAVLDEDCGHG